MGLLGAEYAHKKHPNLLRPIISQNTFRKPSVDQLQKCSKDTCHLKDPLITVSTENLTLPKGRSRKLMPKFIRPYSMTESHLRESRYNLDLLAKLKA